MYACVCYKLIYSFIYLIAHIIYFYLFINFLNAKKMNKKIMLI